MLISFREILRLAETRKCAVGAFNTPNMESIYAVIEAAEKCGSPVIVNHAQIHEYAAPLTKIGRAMVMEARAAGVPVCVQLDHCESLDYFRRALDLGFTGAMYDGSTLSHEENLENTRKAVEIAAEYGVGVEGEIGRLAQREGTVGGDIGPVYTEPEDAKAFAEATGICALAPSFGTSHGIYKSKPRLDLDRVAVIRDLVGLPLVMHGGSGVSPEDYRTAIRNGIRKINYYSYMAREGVLAVKAELSRRDVTFYHDLALAAQNAMRDDAEKAIRLFACAE